VEAIIVTIDPGQLSLAAAEGSAFGTELIECLSGWDRALLDLARSLAAECADGYPNGPLFRNDMASTFIDGLLIRHTSKLKGPLRGRLDDECSIVSGTTSLPIWMGASRLMRWLKSPVTARFTSRCICAIDRHDSAPLRRASALAARS
jgi:hypothetical protein